MGLGIPQDERLKVFIRNLDSVLEKDGVNIVQLASGDGYPLVLAHLCLGDCIDVHLDGFRVKRKGRCMNVIQSSKEIGETPCRKVTEDVRTLVDLVLLELTEHVSSKRVMMKLVETQIAQPRVVRRVAKVKLVVIRVGIHDSKQTLVDWYHTEWGFT